MPTLETITAFIAMVFTAVAMGYDLKTRRIPNGLTVSAFAAGIAFHTIASGFSGLGFSLMGFVAGFLPMVLLWLIGGGGGGDVKLMGALGAWVGGPVVLIIFIGSAATTMLWMIVTLIGRALLRGQPVANVKSNDVALDMEASPNGLLPYAIPVAMTTWVWMLIKFAAAMASAQ
jgi:prepilin peptidase CpaA